MRRKKISHAQPANQPTNIKQQWKWIFKVHSKFHALYSPLKGERSHSGNKIPTKQSTHLFQIIIISKYFMQSFLTLKIYEEIVLPRCHQLHLCCLFIFHIKQNILKVFGMKRLCILLAYNLWKKNHSIEKIETVGKELEQSSTSSLDHSKTKCIPVTICFYDTLPMCQVVTLCSTDVIFSFKLLTIDQTRSPEKLNLQSAKTKCTRIKSPNISR